MAKPELGTKRVCPTTGRKFYDLNRDPIVSPYTGEAIPRVSFEPPTRGGASAGAAVAARDEDDEEAEGVVAGAETVSLEEVESSEEAAGDVAVDGDDAVVEDDAVAEDDAFLEEEEEAGGDVSDLIDGDLEEDEES